MINDHCPQEESALTKKTWITPEELKIVNWYRAEEAYLNAAMITTL
jgi:hypothetical protein